MSRGWTAVLIIVLLFIVLFFMAAGKGRELREAQERSVPPRTGDFYQRLDAGADCPELFGIRNGLDPKDRRIPEINNALRAVQCFGATSTRVKPDTEIPLDQRRAATVKKYLDDNFGAYGAASWYAYIRTVSVSGKRVIVRASLDVGGDRAAAICGAVSGLIFSANNKSGLDTVEVANSDGSRTLLVRRGISGKCK